MAEGATQPVPEEAPELVEGQEGPVMANGDIGEVAVNSAVPIPVTEAPDDTRWDYAKASTIGTAVREEGAMQTPDLFDKPRIQEIAAKPRSKQPDSWLVSRHKKELQGLQTEAKWHEQDGTEIPEDLKEKTEEAQKNLDWALENQLQNQLDPTGKRMQVAEQERNNKIGKIEEVYEKLYDLNPELFAQMPTSEFMQILPEFKTVMEEARRAEWSKQLMGRLESELEGIVSQRRILPAVLEGRVASAISEALALGNEDVNRAIRQEIFIKFGAIDKADNYDTTPNQITQKKLEMIREYAELIVKKREEVEQRKQEFMAKYAKKSEETPPAES